MNPSGSRNPILRNMRAFAPLKEDFLRNRRAIALGLSSLLVVDFLQLIIPLVIRRAVDALTLGEATLQLLLELAGAVTGLAVLVALLRVLWRFLLLGNARKVEQNLRNRLYGHLQTLPLSFYHRVSTGDLMARAINDINAVRMAAGMGVVALTDGVVLGTAAMGFMFAINARLAFIALLPAPLVVVLSRILTRRMSTGFERVQQTFSHLTERVREAFSGVRVIKAYGRESWALERVRSGGERYVAENMRLARTLALFFPMMAVFTNVGLAVVIWIGGRLVILEQISTGDFVAFTAYLNLLTWPMMAMGWVTNLIQRGAASMRRIQGILAEPPQDRSGETCPQQAAFRGQIEFRALSYRYPGSDQDALCGVSLHVRPGETVALVGRVGSGKSTLLCTLPRLLEPAVGSVFLDGVDVRRIFLETLRGKIGFATQEPFVFSDTVRNNLTLGQDGFSKEALMTALQDACVAEEVLGMPDGLDTLVGERGLSLSGGQRQRIALARALLVDPVVLILDDALSMVDARTEERILDRLLAARRGRTNLIVSNRISTIHRADRVIVLEKGLLAEEDTHEGLLRRGGLYARIYRQQLLQYELEATVENHAG